MRKRKRVSFIRATGIFAAAFAVLVAGGQALASSGCDEVNAGAFNFTASGETQTNPFVGGFNAGDTINAIGSGAVPEDYVININAVRVHSVGDPAVFSFTFAVNNSNVFVQVRETTSLTVTCPAAPPTVTSLSPISGPTAGGTSVTITGMGFTGATSVKFGSTAAPFAVSSDTSITATSPAGTGTVNVTVTTPGSTSTTSTTDQFTYIAAPTVTSINPTSGPATGGTSVAITGTNFTGATAVKFGSSNASSFTVNSATSIAAVSPAGTGTVDVTVTTPAGNSPTSAADHFTYMQVSTTTSLTSSQNPSTVGQSVTFTAAVSGSSGTPTGTVTFKDGATTLGTGTLNGGGQATFSASSLTPGSHSITATYNGDASFTASTSAPLTQTVNHGTTSVTVTSSKNPSEFGQAVTFTATVSASGGTPTGNVTFKDSATVLATVGLSGNTATFTTSSLTLGTHSITATYNGDAHFTASTSAALLQAVNVPADSLRAKALQNQITPIVAQISGQSITGAIDGATGDAFGGGSGPIIGSQNGLTFNFAAERDSRIAEAYAALGYPANVTNALAPQREWHLWLDLRSTGWTATNPNADLQGQQVNVTAGLSRKLTPDLLIGIVSGFEAFKYDVASLNGTLKGNGVTIGSYAALRLGGTLRFDAAVAWSGLDYDLTACTAMGKFHGSRWLGSAGLTGTYGIGAVIVQPSAKVFVLRQNENAWADSLGTLQDARTFTAGRASVGAKVTSAVALLSGVRFAPYIGLYGDYRFLSDNALPVGQPVVGIKDGLSARATAGGAFTGAGGASLSLGGELGGLGSNSRVWSGNVRGSVPF
ncbi:MAG: hypothetical protein QOI12_5222 [Alphaproteobacteria bacterium]|nr:hypothetical protein [Alphaproteobacteria bacterium]